ncbi:cytochrome c oxidase subunit 6A1, mitochondrial [Danaus plexippus]|uniref:Cytochrome c oxidase subunit n=1 Tax=Danaus plexippus plexippus TaxID=278856 RepID=A0A212FL96_DANPL|nr:cytochrome c oxidase subunit 6A1, mitochondrial [Danaus plexippus]OWR54511.1 mitochondrial cytochrome c oxidase subunit VIa [Danaus plexippus plexippus]
MASFLNRAAQQYMKNNVRLASHAATAGGHGGGWQLWKRLSIFVAVPAIGLGMLNAYLAHQEEHHERPPFVAFEYLRVRTKRFPWGDGQKTLFHNPHVNALPSGYEDEH